MRKFTMLLFFGIFHFSANSQINPLAENLTKDADFAQAVVPPPIIDLNCDPCKEPSIKINFPGGGAATVYDNNLINFSQNISIVAQPIKLIKSIKAELTYFEFLPESEDCFPCNKNSVTFGNYGNSTIAALPGSGAGTHSMLWTFLPPKIPDNYLALFNITLPPSVKCCTGYIRWCIRYVIEFDDCTVCHKTVCYEKKKTTTVPAPIPTGNPNLQK